jgi:hypothetical protein
MERLALSKQTRHRFPMEQFNLTKLKGVEGKGQYRFEISNRFAAFGDVDTEVDTNRAWETIRENVNFRPERV